MQGHLLKKQLHHLIYVYNTADFDSEQSFLERYPGDEWVDVMSFDRYQYAGPNSKKDFLAVMQAQLDLLGRMGAKQKKPIALAETGYETIPDSSWWTGTLYPLIRRVPLSFVLVWRNHGFMASANKYHYYAPYPGHASNPDFIRFFKRPDVLFERALAGLKIYH